LLLPLWWSAADPGAGPAARAADDAKPAVKERREAAGKSACSKGMILRREGPDGKWQAVGEGETLSTGDLLIGLPGAALDIGGGAVRVEMVRYLDSPYPVMEPAVVLHKTPGFDLDFTLDRGLVEVVNRKEKGAAKVRVRAHNATWELTLDQPKTRVLLELYGFWPNGTPFKLKPGPKDVPSASLLFLVLGGQAALKHNGKLLALHAPPGPAMIQWDNATGMDDSPQRLEKLPDWAFPPKDAEGKARLEKVKATIKRFGAAVASRPIGAVVDEFLESKDPLERRVAVIAMGATDDLARLGKALREAKHADVWDNGVLVVRHWIGRGPGQDLKLYNRLIETKQYTRVQAETVMQFLHGFSETDLARPETYEMLIDYLAGDNLAIRGLAHWHLYRLVPQGRKIAYDPLAPKEARARAREEWKTLIPSGKLPPKPKGGDK
jgi:hypothetical protein